MQKKRQYVKLATFITIFLIASVVNVAFAGFDSDSKKEYISSSYSENNISLSKLQIGGNIGYPIFHNLLNEIESKEENNVLVISSTLDDIIVTNNVTIDSINHPRHVDISAQTQGQNDDTIYHSTSSDAETEAIVLALNDTKEMTTMEKIEIAIANASIKYDIDAKLIKAIIAVESEFNPSLEGDCHLVNIAVGLMQIRKPVTDDLGIEWNREKLKEIDYNIDIGVQYLHLLKTHYFPFYEGEGAVPTPSQLARMFNGGPKGYRSNATLKYEKKFMTHYSSY